MSVMTKRILVSLPGEMYESLREFAKSEYKSISGIVRESILEKLNDQFSKKEINLIEKGRSEYRQGKGIDWRFVKRG